MQPDDIVAKVLALSGEARYRRYFVETLTGLCAVDTTVGRSPEACRAGEAACLGLVARELGASLPLDATVEKRRIDPRIAEYPDFTPPPGGLPVEACYADRYNVIASVPGDRARGVPVIYNAHIDTVAPFVPPRVEAGRVFGRGAADDKGSAALLLTALKLLGDLAEAARVAPRAPRVYQFVIEEETGGNGTLSALLDPEFDGYAGLVLEITSLAVHPANRGAVWYQALLRAPTPAVRIAELAAEVILSLEAEGAAIKRESDHPLFLPHHVQTCHGILGPYGKHPSAVNDFVAVRVRGLSAERLARAIDDGLAAYVAGYGDKTRTLDADTGRPVVARHVTATAEGPDTARVEVHGKAGHMGAIHRCDCALIKAAFAIRAAVAAGGRVELVEGEAAETLLEGGQGFVPTHRLEAVTERLARAAGRGGAALARRLGLGEEAARSLVAVSFDKLHNDAFAGDPASAILARLERCWARAGRAWSPPRGWDVSCDARIFHHFGHDVVVWGPGELRLAHGPDESLSIDEAMEALPLLCLFTLEAGGALV